MKLRIWFGLALAGMALAAPAGAKRTMTPDDLARIREVSAPAVDPAGEWVAYEVTSVDAKADEQVSHVWMTRWDGSRSIQLTGREGESESTPRFSPDGRWIAFLSSRADEKERDRLWIMDRAGGEARPAAALNGSVVDYAWSPDGRSMAVILADPDPDEKDEAKNEDKDDEKKPKPIVIDRFQFKEDASGYLGKQRQRLMLLDIASGKARRLTTGDYDEYLPAWSPDGKRIAFVSKRGADPDRDYNYDLFSVEAGGAAAEPKRLTRFEGGDNEPDYESYPAWSPDGKWIAYIQGGPIALIAYGTHRLAVIPADGGEAKVLTASLDRNIVQPAWSPDGKSLRFIVEDDGAFWIGEVAAAGGEARRLSSERVAIDAFTQNAAGKAALLVSKATAPGEIHALDGGAFRQLSRQNEAWLAEVTLAPVEETKFRSADGTEIHGFLTRPSGGGKGPFPAVLRIHGGPQWQYDAGFQGDWQLLAARGYAVIAANPRGSTGRGQDFGKGIYAAWGSVDVADVLAAVDDAVAKRVADPRRLGVGGWSYGGMLTNYVIASDTRFKAATSGAGISNILAGYGTDQYIRDYEIELGRPWEKPEAWMRVSYPFYHADRIRTPTLFMAGDKDFNVPLLNSEQMYQALKSLGIDTQLVIYPGEHHGLKRPSFIRDRAQRTLDWYDARLK